MRIIFFIVFLMMTNSVIGQWAKATLGTEFTVALGADGTLWSWGYNGNGQLGLDSGSDFIDTPSQIGTDTDWVDVSAGSFHCLAIKADGTLWAWGLGASGQLGNNNTQQQSSPVQIGVDTDWASISAGWVHSHAIKTNGKLYGCGSNLYGQIGNGTNTDVSTFIEIAGSNWTAVADGGAHTLGLKSDGTVWAWGFNVTGQLGTGNTNNVTIPVQVGTDTDWQQIDAGFEYSLALKTNGDLYSWGFNGNGQLGNGTTDNSSSPGKVPAEESFIHFSAGSAYVLAISMENKLFGWGANIAGELGNGSTAQQNNIVGIGSDEDWEAVYAADGGLNATGLLNGFHTMGLKANRSEFCVAGANYVGQLGNDETTDQISFACNVGDGLVGFDELVNGEKIEVFPNPVLDVMQIDLGEVAVHAISISDLSGREWQQQEVRNNYLSIDLSNLPSGIYVMTFEDENGSHFTKKIVKI